MNEKNFCFCCGKPLSLDSKIELEYLWHTRCIRKFFGTDVLPQINIDKAQLEQLVTDTVGKRFTVAGVQKKLSLHLSKETENRLTIVGYPAGFILKPQTQDFPLMPEVEQLVMTMADFAGIKTVPHGLIKMNSEFAYITKRIDRNQKKKSLEVYAMEDFCQLGERLTEEKYKSSYEQCAKIIRKYSSRPGLDLSELFYRLLFCFVTGNSDMHLKNFSLIENPPKSRNFELSKAYDLLAVNVVMPEDKEETALTLNRKKANIKRGDFIYFAEYCSIPLAAAEKMIAKICGMKESFLELICQSLLSEELKQAFEKLLMERTERLEK